MLIRIPGVFDADALARARALLEDAPWTDGATTAGTQALQVKRNQQLPVTCAPAQALQSMVLGALERHPVFFSAALPKRVFPPMFNRYGGAANTYGAHVDNAIRYTPGRGERVRTESGGFYVQPTVFDHATNDMRIAREEIFGPVMSVIRFETEEEAVRLANATPYGLQASVWSHDLNRAHRVARALRAGTVHVNQYDEDDITVPFGGYKQSGNGRDKSLHALEKYTELKTTWLRLDDA